MVLHGCKQNAARLSRRTAAGDAAADADGFALVLPEQKNGLGPWMGGHNHPTSCFNFAELGQSIRDSGEALSIRQMVAHAARRFTPIRTGSSSPASPPAAA